MAAAIAVNPVVEEPLQATNACRLSFIARWLLFIFVVTSVVIWPPIQEHEALTSDIVSTKIVPRLAIVREAAVAAREVVVMFRPELRGVSRLLETLYEGICARAWYVVKPVCGILT